MMRSRPERLAELRDVDLKRLLRRLRRLVLPERLDQAVSRDDLVRMEKQESEERTLLGAADVEDLPVLDDLEWSEDTELHQAADGSTAWTQPQDGLRRGFTGA